MSVDGRASITRFVVAAFAGLAMPCAASSQAPRDSSEVKHVAVNPVVGVHFDAWQYVSVTLGVRAIRRRWWAMDSGVEPGVAAIAYIQPGLAGARAGVSAGWIGVEYEAPRETNKVAEVAGVQVGPSVLQTWLRTPAGERPATYAGVVTQLNFFFSASGGLYWRVAGNNEARRPIGVVSFGFGY